MGKPGYAFAITLVRQLFLYIPLLLLLDTVWGFDGMLCMAINNMLKTSDFDVAEYMPDTLMSSVNVAANTAVVNALIVSIVCTAIFLTITVKVFNTRDVK